MWRFFKYYPAIPLLGIYPEKTIIQKDMCTPMFTAALFTIAGTWKQPRYPSTGEWINKLWVNSGKSVRLYFAGSKSLQMVTAAMKLKDAYSLEEKL